MLSIGQYNTLEVVRFSRPGAYLGFAEGEVLLPGKYVPAGLAVGDCLEVFVYTDSEDRPVATTRPPLAQVGDFASLRCVKSLPFGAFLDWGLEKDLFVPRDCQKLPMAEGRRYVVYVSLDEVSGRVVGLPRLQRFLEDRATGLERGQAVDLLIWERTDLGYKAVVNQRFSGLLYEDQVCRPVQSGDCVNGYVRRVRPDGRLDLTLLPQGYESLLEQKAPLLAALKDAGGFIPCNSQTDPDTIRASFGLSKKAFKKLIGALYKEGVIRIDEKGIHLLAERSQGEGR